MAQPTSTSTASAPAGHIVRSYESELAQLRSLMADMGGLVENQVELAIRAVVSNDDEAAGQAIEQDHEVDTLEQQVESFVIRLLALRQPMAGDLREIVAALRITAALERIGDYARNIAKRSMVLAASPFPHRLSGIAHMGRMVQENLKLAIDAIGEADPGKAAHVWESDRMVDEIYNGIFRELVTYMMEDPRNITPCTHLLFIAKNLERVGDHSTNIAETVHYSATGEKLPESRPKGRDAMHDAMHDAISEDP